MGYKEAGVNIDAGEEAVERIKRMVRTTFTPGVLTDIGRFGGFFALDISKYRQPVLVASIDGVGTKLRVACMSGKHGTIGQDLVNHCVNDIFVGGADPLFFLDYIGTGKLQPGIIEEIISGMTKACRETGCSLIGGEMAEMPGFYQPGDYDVAGCIIGVVEKDRMIDGSAIEEGDVLIGLPSNGMHTNGYSLARMILFEHLGLEVTSRIEEIGSTVGEELLRVHKCYYKQVKPLLSEITVRGMSHITGGGLIGNTKRILPEGLILDVNWSSWSVPPVFTYLQQKGSIPDEEMRRTFNMGIGFVIIVDPGSKEKAIKLLRKNGEQPLVIGNVVRRK